MTLHYETVAPELLKVLKELMLLPSLRNFVLVGGTNLALQRGHRISVDIDLFTADDYISIDWNKIATEITETFPLCENIASLREPRVGYHLFVGYKTDELLKVDLWCVDPFVFPIHITDGIRMADIREIAAFKLGAAVQEIRRQKDFWDINEMLQVFSLRQMIDFASLRYPYNFSKEELLHSLATVDEVELAPEGIQCLRGNYWELIVMDLEQLAKEFDS